MRTERTTVEVHDDPLGGSGGRFALGRPRFGSAFPAEAPSSVRPFGLRFAVVLESAAAVVPPWRYCPDRQIAVTPAGAPWRELVDMTMKTTGYSTDGGGSTGNEEFSPDFVDEEPAPL